MNCTSCRHELPAAARFCPSCGTPCPSPVAAAPEDERKLVTAVFCDLVGSTALSGVLDPETLRTVTLRYFAVMSERIEAHGGTPEKFIGDAVMAVFGVPVMREDDARRALAAALGMREALAELNTDLEATLGIRLDIRIGVNTGLVVASSDASTRQALISGETVNVAARLEQNAAAGEILIGPQTLEAAGPTVVVREKGPLRLKGKTDSVHAYRLIALGADDPELLRRFDVPFIGRTAERAALDEALARTARGAGPGLVRLVGDAGTGKTRLAREWLTGLGGPGRPVSGTGRCRSYGDHGTLAPLADAVREVLGSPVAQEALDGASGRSGASVADARALLRGGLLHDGTPNAPFEDMCAALITVLSRTAERRPVLLVLDDWHWAEPLLVRAVHRLAGPLGRAGGLIVCPGRPDGPPAAADPAACPAQLLPLTGLPPDEAALLARELTGPGTGASSGNASPDTTAAPAAPDAHDRDPDAYAHGLDAHDRDREAHDRDPDAYDRDLYVRAEGNPLYLEQLLVPTGPAPEGARNIPGSALPPTLQALLGARIGALERAERTTLDLAAVVGRDFTAPELVRLTRAARETEGAVRNAPAAPTDVPAPEDDRGLVARALARLRGRRLVESAPGGEPGAGRHRFSSGLVQEVAYASLSKRAKAERHTWASELPSVTAAGEAAVGGHLERAYRYRTELGLADDRAAALRVRAAAALASAGAQALARSDLHWAQGLLERAAGLHPAGDPAAAPVLRRLGEVRLALGRTDEGERLLRQVLAIGTAPVEAAHARLALAVLDPASVSVSATARSVLPLFESAGDWVGQARARLRLAQRLQLAGRHEEADRDLTLALDHAARAEAEPERAAALGAIGISLWRGPEPVPVAVARCRDLLTAHGAGRPAVRTTLNCPLAVLHALHGRADRARECLAEAERLADELGYAEAEVFLPVFRATVEALLGRTGPALELLVRADRAAARGGARSMRPAIALEAARLLLDDDRPDEAGPWLEGAGAPRSLPHADRVDLTGLRARLAAGSGDAATALRLADRAVRDSLLTDSPLVRATASLDRARTLSLLGDATGAAGAAREAREGFAEKGHLPGERWAARLAAESAAATTERS
ncbi:MULTISPECIES: adenylate/guanylate cyclase domain-containing protein [unclassified Streptomyces]|uniref:adenylate/guanylate cyclase domain-containing protein n=1 Tax=unclassified Streptomyces TaxID=2593676 RepID=UPI00081B5D85|nr:MULTISPECIES: adenylate/guanylate cyclase domain-containing protein [unclassified Streptomyces]MYQ88048.1 AAA family ATPase [Streptomyces sp. SID4936]SCE51943.1 Adenylate cyclase, class 3 [Streptomyces sp. DvalAA-43]